MTSPDTARLAAELVRYTHDPLGFVCDSIPWGQGALRGYRGPRPWQADVLQEIGAALAAGRTPILTAVASGHGVGKSALVAWLVLWAMATREHTRGVVTANTEGQLRGKTWGELARWYGVWLLQPLFTKTATALYAKEAERNWRVDMVPWSEQWPESFAGLHNAGGRTLIIMDEASAIPDGIWEVTEGALTDEDGEILWCAFGNPTRNTGRFRECFGRFKHRWATRQIDSRTVEGTNKTLIDQWVDDYGEDSDFVRVRVRGMFPRASVKQFIPSDIVAEARSRDPVSDPGAPVILGVDVAREGDDESVIVIRRGRDAQTVPWVTLREADTMRTAAAIVEAIKMHRPDAVFIDEGGVGGGVVDRVRQLGHAVIGVKFGAKADRSSTAGADAQGERFANKRAEMWGAMRAWLAGGGAIPDDQDLADQLIGPEYGHTLKDEIILEAKKDMKKRGLASPDRADALALTFAYPVAPRPLRKDAADHAPHQAQTDYDPYANL